MAREQARQRLIEAAFALFEERGYEQTTVDDIAERAGVGRTTFFRAFRAKEEVIFPDHDAMLRAITDRLAVSTHRGPLDAVSDAVRLVLRHYVEEGELALARYQLTRSVSALRDREIASTHQYHRLFYRYLHHRLGDAPDTALKAELMAAAVVTTHNHVLRRYLRGHSTDPEPEFDQAMSFSANLFTEREGPSGEANLVVFRTSKDFDLVLGALRTVLDEPS